MKKVLMLGVSLAIAGSAIAAPNVTNATQKGSLLIWPDIRVDNTDTGRPASAWNTLVRIQNDGSSDVDVKCFWLDGNKNRVDFIITITKNQPFWFDARSGQGTFQVNPFPLTPANGIDNPFLVPDNANDENTDDSGPYTRGLLACWAIDTGALNQVKWNHLSGTATVYHTSANLSFGAYEYNAYAFATPTGIDLSPVGVAGVLNLNGIEYDSCPLYLIGQFTPSGAVFPGTGAPVGGNRLAVAACTLNLNQDWIKVWTKLQFDVWNEDEIKFTGAYECSDSWHETAFNAVGKNRIDAAGQNFDVATLGTVSARYRVQGIKSTQCESATVVTQAVGLLGVHGAGLVFPQRVAAVATTLTGAGKINGAVVWDPEGVVPEGAIR